MASGIPPNTKGGGMTFMRKIISGAALLAILISSPAKADWPVIDVASIARMAEMINQASMQLTQLRMQYESLNGVSGIGSLLNNPMLWRYLPPDYQIILNSGYGGWNVIRANSRIYGIEQTTLGPNTDTARLFEANANQVAIDRAINEEAYRQASLRVNNLQVLLDKINESPDAKDIADLQARIQAEQALLQNESIKLNMLSRLQQTQKDLMGQQAAEIRMKTRGIVPRF